MKASPYQFLGDLFSRCSFQPPIFLAGVPFLKMHVNNHSHSSFHSESYSFYVSRLRFYKTWRSWMKAFSNLLWEVTQNCHYSTHTILQNSWHFKYGLERTLANIFLLQTQFHLHSVVQYDGRQWSVPIHTLQSPCGEHMASTMALDQIYTWSSVLGTQFPGMEGLYSH